MIPVAFINLFSNIHPSCLSICAALPTPSLDMSLPALVFSSSPFIAPVSYYSQQK